jgi:hypothetical protein
MRLFGWTVKRAGRGSLAAIGVDADGAEAKVSVVSIAPRGRSVFVIDSKGEEHELVLGGQTN